MKENTIFDFMYPTFKASKKIRLIELFAGIGSQAKALRNLGASFETYRVVEFDQYAIDSYNAVHGTQFQTSDIRDIHAEDLGIVDRDQFCYICTYSFPCQSLSITGNREGMAKGKGTRSGLLWEVERILDECGEDLPQVLLMENVPNVIGRKNIKDFQLWETKLEHLGYTNYVKILNAKDYGIPQNRERCFMVSILGRYNYEFPKGRKLVLRLRDMLDAEVDEKYYVSDLGVKYITNPIRIRKMFTQVDGDIAIAVTAKGQNNWTGTFISGPGGRLRKLTPRESWKLMGFTEEDFDKAGRVNSDTQLYKQAGNSIVVQVLEAIIGQMI